MAGWPTRLTRAVLGPKLRDLIPAPNIRNWIPASIFELAWWTLTGLAMVAPKAWFAYSGGVGSGLGGATVWGSGQPGNAKNATGSYTFTFSATATNELGESAPTSLMWAKAYAVGELNLRAVAQVTSATTVDVRVYDADSGAAADAVVFVEVH